MTAYRSDPERCCVHDAGWHHLKSGVAITRLSIWDLDSDGFARLGHGEAKEMLGEHGMRLPTVDEYLELEAVALHIDPYTLPTTEMIVAAGVPKPWRMSDGSDSPQMAKYRADNMRTRAWCEQHDAEVLARLRAAGWVEEPVANDGKHWARGGIIFGWKNKNGTRIQGPSKFHAKNPKYTDYATLFHGVRDCDHDPVYGADDAPDTSPPSVLVTATQWRSPLKLGMEGPDVGAWQRVLLADGYDLGRRRDDDDFGKLTHNATVSWQGERGLAKDGKVGLNTRNAIGDRPLVRIEPDLLGWLFREARHFTRASRSAVHWFVIHTSEAREASTTAEALQAYCATMADNRQASWHFAVDDDSVTQSVLEEHVAYHCPGLNRYGIGVEQAGFARQNEAQWRDPFSTRMRELVAQLAASVLDRWAMPAQFITAEQLDVAHALIVNGQPVPNELRGITTHNQGRKSKISRGRTLHSDPGRTYERIMIPELVDRVIALL